MVLRMVSKAYNSLVELQVRSRYLLLWIFLCVLDMEDCFIGRVVNDSDY